MAAWRAALMVGSKADLKAAWKVALWVARSAEWMAERMAGWMVA